MVFTTYDCPAFSADNEPLGAATVDNRNRITCSYPQFDCRYSPVDGSIVESESHSIIPACRHSLVNTMDSSAPPSASSTSTSTSQKSSVNQPSTPSPKPISSSTTSGTTQQHVHSPTFIPDAKGAPTHLKPSIIAAIVVIILIFLVVSAVTFIWYRRRHSLMRAPQPGAESRLNSRTIFPFVLPTPTTSFRNRDGPRQRITDKRNINVSRPLAQRVLQNELDAAREKVAELEEQEARLLGGPVSESAAIQRQRSDNEREAPESTPQDDLAVQLQAAREEINLLARRIADNEEIQAFGWGRAGENEPPPEYV
ncbi:hypothetical protein R3P38DRAFT_410125 [Favolaschia claudopus]|uniref:Uncharacterized protein n=1 Tax=Favolaschia claudopus TaxID=2862362 RepID=A0AAV9ZH20_9AGAR